MIFFILYAIGVWAAVYLLRGKWHAPAVLVAAIVPVSAMTVLLVMPSLHPQARDIAFAGVGGYGRLLSIFSGAYGFVILLVGAVIIVTPRRIPPGCCNTCAYDLSGLGSPVCPECGSVIA